MYRNHHDTQDWYKIFVPTEDKQLWEENHRRYTTRLEKIFLEENLDNKFGQLISCRQVVYKQYLFWHEIHKYYYKEIFTKGGGDSDWGVETLGLFDFHLREELDFFTREGLKFDYSEDT